MFAKNQAIYGGALYLKDGSNSDACLSNTECFIQALQAKLEDIHAIIFFSNNTAVERGSNLFGGLLDRCILSPFSNVFFIERIEYDGIMAVRNISQMELKSTSSLPVSVCFCNNQGLQDCDYQPTPIRVKKGEPFNISLVAVDQVNTSIEANIVSSIISHDGGFAEGQRTQAVNRNCTQLTFNVYSPLDLI